MYPPSSLPSTGMLPIGMITGKKRDGYPMVGIGSRGAGLLYSVHVPILTCFLCIPSPLLGATLPY